MKKIVPRMALLALVVQAAACSVGEAREFEDLTGGNAGGGAAGAARPTGVDSGGASGGQPAEDAGSGRAGSADNEGIGGGDGGIAVQGATGGGSPSDGSAGSAGRSEAGQTGSATKPTPSAVGAWYGAGAGFPDGDLCFIFCENGRLFAGDRPCTETDAGDFTQYLQYTVTGSTFEARAPDGIQMTGTFEVTGDVASFTMDIVDSGQFALPPMTRTAESSPLCTSDIPIWEGW